MSVARATTKESERPTREGEPSRGRVAPEELLRFKRSVSIVELVESYGVMLTGSGDNLRGSCCFPGHEDTTPSLIVSPSKGLFHCMGKCNVGGDVIAWVMRKEGCSFVRAIEILRAQAPLTPLPARSRRSSPPPAPLVTSDEPDADVLRCVVLEEYPRNFKQDRVAQLYLEKRGLGDAEMLEHWSRKSRMRSSGSRSTVRGWGRRCDRRRVRG